MIHYNRPIQVYYMRTRSYTAYKIILESKMAIALQSIPKCGKFLVYITKY
jgi:hypothetical protein